MARSRTLSAGSVLRARIVLHRASGESFRDLGQALGCDHRTAWQCLKRWEEAGSDGLEKERPGRGRKSWVSDDPHFEAKLVDIVALDRTQPGLPMKKGRCGTMTHDDKRNGTTTLFAAMNTLDGTVIPATMPRHRHDEWLKFLERLERNTPKRPAPHIICDNDATHKHPAVKTWLERHTRVHVPFTPTRSSWLNRVERFFRDITENRIRRGISRSVPELEEAIRA